MTENVRVDYGEDAGETATKLLEAAEEKGYEPYVVATTSDEQFWVPADVAKAAGLKAVDPPGLSTDESSIEAEAQRLADAETTRDALAEREAHLNNQDAAQGGERRVRTDQPAKKAAAKKSAKKAAKKAPAKKAAARKRAPAKKAAAKKTTVKKTTAAPAAASGK